MAKPSDGDSPDRAVNDLTPANLGGTLPDTKCLGGRRVVGLPVGDPFPGVLPPP
ncbi:hypothetical protein MSIMFI_03753 [Mycobacterium simulans]|nr:hypothetical protein MSIMFI_03753 [Mycobacterium simulans]